jgi:hypothetical protein
MDCKAVVRLPQNAALDSSDVMGLRAAANIYLTTPKPGATGRRFASSADYVKYKKAASLAGSSTSPVLPPQTNVITQLQNAGC